MRDELIYQKEIQSYLNEEHTLSSEESLFFLECAKHFPDISLIKKAYYTAKDLHRGQRREDGELYITHPLRVAIILLKEIKLIDINSVCAALMHDTVEDTGISLEFIRQNFNEEIAGLVDGVTKIKSLNFRSKSEEDSFNNALMLRKIIDNPKILLIKLADRLHNMRTLEYKNDPNKRVNKALETNSFYVPIASVIGNRLIKEELEERCFMFLTPEVYERHKYIKRDYENAHLSYIYQTLDYLTYLIKDIKGAKVTMRGANIYTYYKSSLTYPRLKEDPNLISYKIEVSTKEDCYQVLNILNKTFKISDYCNYIKEPKINDFKALCFIINDYRPLSIEVSTKAMALTNDYGYAPLFKLKHSAQIINKTAFMQILSRISAKYQADVDFYSAVNKELLVEHIKVYTPQGKVVWLRYGATVQDFAYQIHSELAFNATGAMVNGEMVDLNFPLNNNDVVEVLVKTRTRSIS